MKQNDLVRRMREAAQAWGRKHLHAPVRVAAVSEPERSADGAVRTTVELQPASPGRQSARVRCLVTLEPDGSLSCFSPDVASPK